MYIQVWQAPLILKALLLVNDYFLYLHNAEQLDKNENCSQSSGIFSLDATNADSYRFRCDKGRSATGHSPCSSSPGCTQPRHVSRYFEQGPVE